MNQVFLGDFALGRRLGEGASSLVFQALHRPSGESVAIKILRPERTPNALARERFAFEVRTLAGLHHPSIVQVLDHGVVDEAASQASGDFFAPGSPWLAMEWARGGDIKARLSSPLSWKEVADLAKALLRSLAHVHARGVIHGDIKPGNVLLPLPSSSLGEAALADLGLSVLWARPGSPRSRSTGGTPGYMAPEQALGATGMGVEADLYSLGALLYHAVCGAPPFAGDSGRRGLSLLMRAPPQVRPRPGMTLPPHLHLLLADLLASSPRERHASAADVLRSLERVEGGDRPLPPRTVRHPLPPGHPWGDWRRYSSPPSPLRLAAGLSLVGLRHPPVTGHEEVKDRLWNSLSLCLQGEGSRVLLLTGPEGSGKSRLARWFLETAGEAGLARGAVARHPDLGGPSEGLRSAMASLLQVGERRGEPLRAWLRTRLPRFSPTHLAALFSFLRPGGEGPSSPPPPEERWLLLNQVLDWESHRLPVLLWLDDVHESMESIEFIKFISGDGNLTRRLVVLATSRKIDGSPPSQEDESLLRLTLSSRVQEIAIPPLPPADAQAMASGILHLQPGLAAQIAAATLGNPLFAVQVVEDLAARGALRSHEGAFDLQPGASLSLPRGVREALRWRTDQACSGMGRDARKALRLLAILSSRPERAEWVASLPASGLPVATESHWWSQWAEAGLLDAADPERASFSHGLLRDLLVDEAEVEGERPELEKACALALTRLHPRPSRYVLARLGRHHLRSGNAVTAFRILLLAGARFHAAADYATEEELLEEAGRALKEGGVPSDDPSWGFIEMREARLRYRDGDRGRFRAVAERVVALHPDEEGRGDPGVDQVLTEAFRVLGITSIERGKVREGLLHLQRAIRGYERAEDAHGSAAVLRAMGHGHLLAGDVTAAEASFAAAETRYRDAADPVGEAQARWSRALSQVYRGELSTALRLFDEAKEAFRGAGSRLGEAESANGSGDVYRRMGRLQEAEEAYREALSGLQGLRSPHASLVEANLGLVCLARGDANAARPLLQGARTAFETQGRFRFAGVVACAQALAAAHFHLLDEVESRITEAENLLGDSPPADPDLAWILRTLAHHPSLSHHPSLASRARALEPPGVEQPSSSDFR